jgi:hypothetical protein
MTTYTQEQILALSPDADSTKNARKLASPRGWPSLGRSEGALWGECKGSGAKPYQVQIDLSEPAFKCSCPSRKFPCKHGLALFLIFFAEPASLIQGEPPDWVKAWLESRGARAEKKAASEAAKIEKAAAQPVDTAAQAKRREAREKKVAAGVDELDLWLRDLVRAGLAAMEDKRWLFWEEDVAKRMIDAQAKGLALQVRGMGEATRNSPAWQQPLLERMGRLHLLLRAYRRREELPANLRDEVLERVGFDLKKEDILANGATVADRWNVLGQIVEQEEQIRVQRTWLIGEKTRQAALVVNFAAGAQPLDVSLTPGTTFEGEVAFYPGARPERALVKSRADKTEPMGDFLGGSVDQLYQARAEALASDPWLDRLPATLEGVSLIRQGEKWLVRDGAKNTAPLTERFDRGWEALAVSGGRPFRLFGEWDGRFLTPLSAWIEKKFMGLGVKAS